MMNKKEAAQYLLDNSYNDKVLGVDVDGVLSNSIDPKIFEALRVLDLSLAANGSMYRKDKRGIMPEIIVGLYDERKAVKKEMLKLKQEYEVSKTKELSREINRLENTQMAIKILLNSLYGALGNQYFRYFEMRIAEGITLSGQLSIKWAEKAMNEAMNMFLKTVDKDYVIAMDTDSLYVNMGPLVNAVKPKDPVSFIDQSCQQKFVPILTKAYGKLFDKMNAYENRMVMAREAIADKGIWMAKKRYILNVYNNEGVQYAQPKLKIMGIEAVKSSTPQVVRDKFVKAYNMMLNSTEAELQKFVADFFDEFKTLPAEDISFPRGVSDIEKWEDKNTIYKKGTPIHVRGALLFNQQLKKANLSQETIRNGTKVKFCYMKMPNPLMENVIAFTQFLPEEFGLNQYIDYEMQFNKTFKEPLELVSNAIKWKLEHVNSLEGFFT
jgi:DNA polymerase elongation subunit (family B)